MAISVVWIREGLAIPEIAANAQARFRLQARVSFSCGHDVLLTVDACLRG